ncbi:hypothetical protein [Streptomyces bauhiniae]
MTVHDLLHLLPDPAALAARCRAFAVLDTVLDPAAARRRTPSTLSAHPVRP